MFTMKAGAYDAHNDAQSQKNSDLIMEKCKKALSNFENK